MSITTFKTWAAYQKGFDLANLIFNVSNSFPNEEKYSLTDQIRRSSRSVCANLAEGFAKRRYPKHFIAKITDAAGENAETQVWLSFALNAQYIDHITHRQLTHKAEEVGRLLSFMEKNPDHFAPRS